MRARGRVVADGTGLRGTGLVAVPPVGLPGADRSGAARLSVAARGSGPGGRPYLLAPARRTAPGQRPGLLLVLPAANALLRTEYDRYGLAALRDHGLAVAVVGTYAASWNAGSCCGRAHRDRIDDVAAVRAVRDDALRRTGADPARVAVVGHSVGAMMAWRLACTPSPATLPPGSPTGPPTPGTPVLGTAGTPSAGAPAPEFAAVVAVSGTLSASCPRLPSTPRTLVVQGARDATVPVDGSRRVITVLGVAPASVRVSARRLSASGGCSAPVVTRPAGSTVSDARDCSGGGSVRLQVVTEAGHAWADLQATRRLAAFLDAVLPGVA